MKRKTTFFAFGAMRGRAAMKRSSNVAALAPKGDSN